METCTDVVSPARMKAAREEGSRAGVEGPGRHRRHAGFARRYVEGRPKRNRAEMRRRPPLEAAGGRTRGRRHDALDKSQRDCSKNSAT